jgi:hypothetical protein
MPGRNVRNLEMAEPQLLPPIEFDNAAVSEIAYQITDVTRHYDHGPFAGAPAGEPRNCPQRGPMQMIEVGVRDQHSIDGWQVAQPQPWLPQAFQHEDPAGEVGVNQNVLARNLEEKAGMSDEGDAQLTAIRQHRLARNSNARSHGRVAHQGAKVAGLTSN